MVEYYNPRPEVAELIPASCRVIVDVGCGTGLLGEQLKAADATRVVYGIEPDATAAARAATALDDVLPESVEAPWPAAWSAPDCLVFADVLEHLVDPWVTLRRTCERLPSGGYVVISIPNAAHYSLVAPLVLYGKWEYRDQGILDRTHLRFFTRRSVFELVHAAGLRVETTLRRVAWPSGAIGYSLLAATAWERRREARRGVERDGRVLLDHVTAQYLVRARKP